MAEAVLSVALETLRDLLLEEARFLFGVSGQVREIQGQLEIMKGFVEDADRKQYKDKTVLAWVQQVKRLAYTTEDVLETYAVEVVSKRSSKGIKNFLKRLACILGEANALHKVGEDIANIKSEISNLSTSRQTFGIKDLNEAGESSKEAKERQRLLRQSYAHEVDEHFVGREDDIRKLVSLMISDESDCRVVSICGMGGIGKTTLARKIFNHREVQRSFEAFAWVSISQQPQIGKVLQDILKQITRMDVPGDQAALVRELYNVLKEKKSLVVLDDTWNLNDWNILRPAFPIIEASSKVILTTRSGEIGKKGYFYQLSNLAEDDGWELLRRKALLRQEEKDPQREQAFEHIGKKIVRKCGNHPLAISTIAGVLRGKSSPKDWEIVSEDIDLYLRKREGSEEAEGSVIHVLALSYDALPYYLKPCFLYMGSLREDESINAETLCFLWVAEGLVLSEHRIEGESMMDVAERYVNELGSRSMVEVEAGDVWINKVVCRLHDLMRELCLAKGKEEDFFKVLNIHSQQEAASYPSRVSSGYHGRRMGVYVSHGVDLSAMGKYNKALFEQMDGQSLRSLFVLWENQIKREFLRGSSLFRWNHYRLGPFDSSIFKKFKLLRVVRLEGCELELPSEISRLIHIRYLSVQNSLVRRVPASLGTLPYLETLHLGTLCDTYVPNIFGKMKRLRHFLIPDDKSKVEKLQLTDLSELETLHGFRFSIDEPVDISQLVQLRSFLGVVDSSTPPGTIDRVNHLRKVKWVMFEMVSSDFTTENGSHLTRKVFLCEKLNYLRIVRSSIGNLPPYEAPFLPNLTWIELEETKIEQDPMHFLEEIPNLQSLFLHANAFMGKELVCNGMGFPELRILYLYGLPNLEKWKVLEGAMPKLSQLTIHNCPKLETITDGINFSSLKRFDILEMPEGFKQKYATLYDRERKKFNG